MGNGKTRRVLIIEDNPADVRLIVELLSREFPGRFEFHTTRSLDEGIGILAGGNIDVVLSDLSLPDSHGKQTVTRIQEADNSVPVVVISGHDSEELAMEIVESGAQDYIVKGQSDAYVLNRAIQYAVARKKIQLRLDRMAKYDGLTGLVNRTMFNELLGRAVSRAERYARRFAVIFLDLDKFKEINDTLGHAAGDELLVAVAERLRSSVRQTDTVARLAGDEFTILLDEVVDAEAVRGVCEKIQGAFTKPASIGGRDIEISSSIGVAIYPKDADTAAALLKCADSAMYQAKQSDSESWCFFGAGTPETPVSGVPTAG